MHNGSLAMSVTFQKFHYLSYSRATGNNFTISGSPRLRSHKITMRYSLFGNVSCTKTYPSILNISLSISIAHQSINVSKFSVCHFHYIMRIKKLLNEKISLKWDLSSHLQCEQLLCYHLHKNPINP